MSEENMPLFCYCLEIQGREFDITVGHDCTIFWDDYQDRRKNRSPEDQYLEMKIISGNKQAKEQLREEIDEYSVSFMLSDALSFEIHLAAEKFEGKNWSTEDEARLDRHLIPLFWERVNSHLKHPLKKNSA